MSALTNLETYAEVDAPVSPIKDAIAATVQDHPLILSDQALVFNLRRLGEWLHVTATNQQVLTIKLAVVHPYGWGVNSAFSDLAIYICSALLPGMDVELSQTPIGDVYARTMLARGVYPALTPTDVKSLTTLAMSAVVLLHAISFSPHER